MLSDGLLAAASAFVQPDPPSLEGTLWSWGNNSSGSSGQGTDTGTTNSPTQITDPNFSDWSAVDAYISLNVGAAIRDGRLYVWGRNNDFDLGLGDTTNRLKPTQSGSDTDWAQVSMGNRSGAAIKTNGTLWTWGQNNNGRTAQGTDTGNTETPTQVGADTDWDKVSMGNAFGFAIKTDGTLHSWGDNSNFQTAQGTDTGNTTSPTQVGTDTDWSEVSMGSQFGFAIKTDGTLHSWGNNGGGRTAQGTASGTTNAPTQVGTDTDWGKVKSADNFGFAIKTDGTLWSWGSNSDFQTAQGTAAGNTTSPTQVGTDTDWSEVSIGGGSFGIALKTNNTLYSWGDNGVFRTAQGTDTGNTETPTQVGTDTDWVAIGSNFATGFAIKSA